MNREVLLEYAEQNMMDEIIGFAITEGILNVDDDFVVNYLYDHYFDYENDEFDFELDFYDSFYNLVLAEQKIEDKMRRWSLDKLESYLR